MNSKSPMTKRQKLQSSSYDDDIREINHVIQLRKNVGEIIDDVYSAETTELLKSLARTEVELNNTGTYTTLDVDEVKGLEGLAKRQDETIEKISNHMVLLNVLESKKNCPIAKIIDEI